MTKNHQYSLKSPLDALGQLAPQEKVPKYTPIILPDLS
jgi:hypothetical protein